ncbi:MAG: hypothetical protein ACXWXV_05100 [Aeromicrobium sp.]
MLVRLNLSDLPKDDAHRADWIAAMVADPILIQPPTGQPSSG